jgi:F-type H+-transporting ATPase subunit delta
VATASLTQTLARRYAQALLAHASDAALQDTVSHELAQWARVTQPGQSLYQLAHNPTLSRAAQAVMLQELASSHAASEPVRRFLVVLAEQRRLDLLSSVSFEFNALVRAARGRRMAVVVSAAALSDAQKDALVAALGTNTDIVWEINAALLGGMTVTIDGKTLDYSLSTRLQRTQRALEKEAA